MASAVAVSYLWHVLLVVLCELYGLGPVLLGVADGGGAVLLGVRVRLDRQVQATEWGLGWLKTKKKIHFYRKQTLKTAVYGRDLKTS